MREAKHLSIYINRDPGAVYAFASNPGNLTRWAAGLASSDVTRVGDVWIAQAPFGTAKIRFAERNSFGVMDHEVELESGEVVYNPMRVVPNGEGSEFIFTLLRQPGMTDEEYASDAAVVAKDLRSLKDILENAS